METCLELCVRWNTFYVNDEACRFWADWIMVGNVDIYMLVVAVDGGPIWNIINVQTAKLLGDAISVTHVVLVASSDATNVRPKIGDYTVNLASIATEMYEKSILEKGLKFIPTPQVSTEALIHGGKQFVRNIKLAHVFHNKSNNVNKCPKMFVPKSSWEHPDSYLPQDIKSEMDKLDVLLNKIHITWEIPNLSNLELQALIN